MVLYIWGFLLLKSWQEWIPEGTRSNTVLGSWRQSPTVYYKLCITPWWYSNKYKWCFSRLILKSKSRKYGWRNLWIRTHLQCWLSQLRWMGPCPVCFVPAHWTGTLSRAPAPAPPTTSEHQKLASNASREDRSRFSLTWAKKWDRKTRKLQMNYTIDNHE